jgi:uncharacterized protein YbgA (DUF1722 family)
VEFTINVSKPALPVRQCAYRNIGDIDLSAMNSDLESVANTGQVSLRDAVAQYHNCITEALDQHAPVKQRTVLLMPNVPWFSEIIVTELNDKGKGG